MKTSASVETTRHPHELGLSILSLTPRRVVFPSPLACMESMESNSTGLSVMHEVSRIISNPNAGLNAGILFLQVLEKSVAAQSET